MKMNGKQFTVAVALCMLAACSMATGQVGTVTGVVVNSSGVGISGVEIDFNGGVSFPAPPVTGATGIFSVSIPAGNYNMTLLPSTATYAPLEVQNIMVPPLSTANLGTITLQTAFPLSGHITNVAGAPVFAADINVYDQATGSKLLTPGDNTDAFGNFLVAVPAGTYRVRIRPPIGSLLVAQQVENVIVTGPTALPTFVLQPGVVLAGTVVNLSTALPIADVDIDVDEALTGTRIITTSDNTNGSGVFQVVVPAGTYHVTFEPPAGSPHVARQIDFVVVPASPLPFNMGTVSLDPGLLLTGTILGPGATPVANADIDVHTSLGRVPILTPGDNTNSAGQFSVVVPAGTFDITVEPPFALNLVGSRVPFVNVTTNTTLPTVTLQAGVIISGTISSWSGAPEVNADIDVVHPLTGAVVVTPHDNSDALGNYAVIVPAGTWNLEVQTAKLSFSQDTTVVGVTVGGTPLITNIQLALVPIGTFVGPDTQAPAPSGGTVFITVAWFNPFTFARTANINLILKNPAGIEQVLVPSIPVMTPGQTFYLLPDVPVGLPPVSTSHLGLPFQLILRFTDPITGEIWDSDRSKFIIQ